MLSFLLELLAPPRKTERVVRELSRTLLADLAYIDGNDGVLPYKHPSVAALIWEIKYYANERAAKLGGALLAERIFAIASETIGTPLLVPIPIHSSRKHERGHNQCEVLCEAVTNILEKSYDTHIVEYAPHALVRTRLTPTQQGLPRATRLTNPRNSMKANPSQVQNRACIVVDDVSTTGATLEEAKRALLEAGARSVACIYLSH